jgi:hypothetical protein
MGVPSAAIVYTGESGNMQGSGRGAAYSEGIGSTLDIIDKGLRDIRENEKLKKQEALQKANAWNSLMEETPDVWNVDYEKVNEKANAYTQYVADLKTAGYDPFNLPAKEMRELTRLRNEVAREATAAKANKEWWDKNTFNINDDAGKTWDQGYAAKWFEKFTDPNLTPSERAKLRQQGNPYLKNVNLVDIVSNIGGQMDEQKITQGGYDITGKNKEDFKKLISIYFADQAGMDDYEALMSGGKYKTDEDLMNDASTIFDSLYKTDKVKRATSGGGTKKKDENVSGYGTGNWNNKLSVSSQVLPNFKSGVTANTLYVTRTGTNDNVPPIQMADATGKTVNFQPISYHLRDDGAISVLGEVIGTDALNNQTRTQTWMDYDANKSAFQSQLMGMDLREEFNARNGGTTGTTKTGKTFTGVPTGGF